MKPENKGSYGVTRGTYCGEILVYIKTSPDGKSYEFLSTPKMISRLVPVESFENGIKSSIIEFIEVLPDDVFEVCLQQYNTNPIMYDKMENRNHR